MKKIIIFVVCIVITLTVQASVAPGFAAALSGSVDVPSEVTKNKSFTANLQAQCGSDIGVVMFTVAYSTNLEYKSCRVNDNSSGYIESVQSDGLLKLMYINTAGVNISSARTLVEVTFSADENVGDATIEVQTSYSTSVDEYELADNDGMRYSISIKEKAVSNPPSAAGRRVAPSNSGRNSSSRGSSNSSAKSKNKSKDGSSSRSEYYNANGEEITSGSTDAKQHKTINAVASENGITLFIAGGGFVLAIALVIACSYFAGKRRAGKAKEEGKVQEKANSNDNEK